MDNDLFNENSEKIYEEQSINILHYQKGSKMSVSYGFGLQKLLIENYYFKHLCNTNPCSYGAPILNLKQIK